MDLSLTDQLKHLVEAIDAVFGEGYAKKNPDLVGQLNQSLAVREVAVAILDTNSCDAITGVGDAIGFAGEAVNSVAARLRDIATQMDYLTVTDK